jgi:hypothetical protein
MWRFPLPHSTLFIIKARPRQHGPVTVPAEWGMPVMKAQLAPFPLGYPTKKWLQPSRAWQGSLKRTWHELPPTKGNLFGFGGSCFLPTAPVAQLVQKLAQCPSPSCAHGHGTVVFLKGKSKHCAKLCQRIRLLVWQCDHVLFCSSSWASPCGDRR